MTMPFNVTNTFPTAPDTAAPVSTNTAQDIVAQQNQPVPPTPTVKPEDKKRHAEFKQRIDTSKQYRRKLVANWTTSIDYRRGKPFASQTDEDTIAVNLDWSMTKTKQAMLFSQVPQVRVDHPPQSLTVPWVPNFERHLNETLVVSGIEATMDECLPDCINAAGIGIALVSYESITEDVSLPSPDTSTFTPQMLEEYKASGSVNGQKVPMTTAPRILAHRYLVERVSPADFLWPIYFTSSSFDKAPWLGRSGRVTKAEAMQRFSIKEDEADTLAGEDRNSMDRLSHDVDKDKTGADQMIGFDEVFYREFQYTPDCKSYDTIHHLVYLNGKDEPVIDEPWKGQRMDEHGLVGSNKLPIRVLALTYITDETIPPSDSAICRPQINEINKSRTQMIRQRERSSPLRWYDSNRMDLTIAQALMRGTWQSIIPTQGDGSRVIGEVARAAMPQENFAFDKIAKADLTEAMGIGPNQDGSGAGVDTAAEANAIQSTFQTRIGRERAKVAAFFTGIAEVLGGLMCLYEDPSVFGDGFDPTFSQALSYSILADSTVLLDANQRLEKLNHFVNLYGKSGWVELEPVLKEIATLAGLDPNAVVKKPEPKPPVEPNISLRLTGVEDMLNPLALAFLIKSGQAPSPDLIEQAKQLIQQSVVPPTPPQQPQMGPDGQPLPPGPEGAPPTPQGAPLPNPSVPPPPGTPLPPAAPTPVGEANPNMTVMSKITKRADMKGQ